MSDDRCQRGIPVPSLWQLLVVSASITACYLIWADSRNQSAVHGPSSLSESPTDELRYYEELVRQGSEAVPNLLAMLEVPEPRTRRNAILALGRVGADASEALEPVRERLGDGDASVRSAAFVAFSQLCHDQTDLLTIAARTLADPDVDVRERAHNLFVATGRPAVPSVIDLLKSDTPIVRSHAIRILVRFNRIGVRVLAANEVQPLVTDSDPDVRLDAIKAISEWDAANPEEALAWLRDDDRQIAFSGLRAADWYMPEAAAAVPDLIRLIDGADGTQLRGLATALRALQAAARPAVPHLLRVLQVPELMQSLTNGPGGTIFLRDELIDTLVEIGAEPQDVRGLLAAGELTSRRIRRILEKIDPAEAQRQVSSLVSQLDDDRPPVVAAALQELEGYGTQARAVAPALTRLIQHADPQIAAQAAWRLVEVRPDDAGPAVPYLLAQIRPDRLESASAIQPAMRALASIGPANRDALPDLFAILEARSLDPVALKSDDQFNWVRLYAMLAIGRIGGDDSQALGGLQKLLLSEVWQDRAAAAEALSASRTSAADVLNSLVGALSDQNAYVRANVALAVGELQGERISAVASLTDSLHDDDAYVQTAAAIALGRIGRNAAPAADVLRDLQRNPVNRIANFRRSPGDLWVWRDDRFFKRRTVAQAVRWALLRIEL